MKPTWKTTRWRGMVMATAALAVLAAALPSGCSSVGPSKYRAAPSRWTGNDAACLERLSKADISYQRVADSRDKRGCTISNGVEVAAIGRIQLSSPAVMTCRMAELLTVYENDVLQPLAYQELGAPVAKITHYGAYSCRARRTGGSGRNVLSEHAYANAFDMASFTLADGRKVSVKTDWKGPAPQQRFLHQAAKQSCGLFPMTLTPNHNAAHHDHLHVDAGQWALCGY